MSKRVLIVGGGMGGTIVANGLARHLGDELRRGEVAITMLGDTDQHFYQPGLLYVPFGRMRESELSREQRQVLNRRVTFHVDPAKHIDVEKNQVTTDSGKTHGYDYLVLATGSRVMPQNIPGMVEGAHWFYELAAARKLRQALDTFQGGTIVVNVNAPHKCPVAPIEVTLMLHDHFRAKGMGEKVRLIYTYPIGRLHGLEPVANWVKPEYDRLGIAYETFFNTSKVDPAGKTISSEEGVDLSYDLLITIPPHQGAQVIDDSGLGKGGWVPTHPRTLHREGSTNVFVVGDTTNIPISKAGSTAHFEADTLIDNLVSLIVDGRMTRTYDGKVYCFLETGMKTGTYIWFDYETPPSPSPPTQMVHWLKLAYNRMYWLSARGLL
ncbi:MAG: NAD(P)/FAD-dependent oxidoreductase [Alphaproteobacteria bacterium]|nr:NAD(P)/FAD-dependent oxidoreductase [Alphaproteobacteria bacterium]